jgi:F0F1-type ATP synthase membrane subunit b/b'
VDEKINQAVQKRQEIVSTFVTKTKENLDAKMEESQEKREAHLNSLKTKLKEHVSVFHCKDKLSGKLIHRV